MFIDDVTDARHGFEQGADGKVRSEDGREVIGWLLCDDCGQPVPVKLNRGGKPYYGCQECNNQHRPQSEISRRHFIARMKPLNHEKTDVKEGVKHGNESSRSEDEEAGISTEANRAEAGISTEAGRVRIGAF